MSVSQMYDPEVTVHSNGTAEGPAVMSGGGLEAHEAAGGHLLGKHVNQSVDALAARLLVNPK